MLSLDFGHEGTHTDMFNLFESISYGQQNLLFSDETVMFKDISTVAGGTKDTYYTWAGKVIMCIAEILVYISCLFLIQQQMLVVSKFQ